MNKKICIVTWVYGIKYQGWIPIYVYSIKKNYPDYDIIVFIDDDLGIEVTNILSKYGLQNEVVIKYCAADRNVFRTDMETRCNRWLIYDEEIINNYEYAYIGDIDIYIDRENPGLLEQHIEHMRNSNGVYSNAVRLNIIDYIKNRKKIPSYHLFKLTGLHFVDTKLYYNRIRKSQQKIYKYLNGKRIGIIDKMFFSDDERCLWLLCWLSRIAPPQGSYQLYKDSFRPLHGIHFALGREYDTYMKMFKEDKNKINNFESYYKHFVDEYNTDKVLRMIVGDSPFYIQRIINKTCNIWGQELFFDGIVNK